MKELSKSLFALIGAIIVSVIFIPYGIIYTLIYGIWFSKRAKKGNRWTAFFRFIWRIIDGILAAFGHLIYAIGYCLDLIWNMFGEAIEDTVTTEEDTEFTKKNVSVSASIGKLQIDGKLNKFGRAFSKALNFAFGQKNHAPGAWRFLQAQRENKKFYNEQ